MIREPARVLVGMARVLFVTPSMPPVSIVCERAVFLSTIIVPVSNCSLPTSEKMSVAKSSTDGIMLECNSSNESVGKKSVVPFVCEDPPVFV